jgi:hypothetical protein
MSEALPLFLSTASFFFFYLFPFDLYLLECEADRSPATIAEVKNTWICTSTPPYAFMV